MKIVKTECSFEAIYAPLVKRGRRPATRFFAGSFTQVGLVLKIKPWPLRLEV
jgi:hypothetical protein